MKQLPVITSVTSNLRIPKTEFENVINYRLRNEKYKVAASYLTSNDVLKDFETVQTRSATATLKGTVTIAFSNGNASDLSRKEIIAAAAFFITCIKSKDNRYKIGVSSCLS